MSLTYVTVTATDATASSGVVSSTTSFSPAAGTLVAIGVSYTFSASGNAGTLTCADSLGNSYTVTPAQQENTAFNSYISAIFLHEYTSAPGAITVNITCTNTAAAFALIEPVVFTGAAISQTGAGVVTADPSGSISAINASITTTTVGSLVFIVGTCSEGSALTPLANTTTLATWNNADSSGIGMTSANTVTPGATTVGWTCSPNSAFGDAFVALEILPAILVAPPATNAHFPPSFYVKRHNAGGMKRRWRPRQSAPPPPPANPKIATLVDNFETNDLATLWAQTVGNVVWSAGKVAIEVDTSYDSQLISTLTDYDLTSSAIYMKVTPYLATSSSTTIQLNCNAGADGMFCGQSGNNFTIYKIIGGTQTNLTNVTFNATSMAWWQITESAGTVSFQTAPDVSGSPGSWTTQYSTADSTFTGSTLNSLQVLVVCGDFGSDPIGTSYVYAVNTSAGSQQYTETLLAAAAIQGTTIRSASRTISAFVSNVGSLGREIFITLPGKIWKQLF